MQEFDPRLLQQIYIPSRDSHKGQNGKVLIVAGSKLFHAASLWPLTVASRIADMVFYSSIKENNELVSKMKEEFRNGIIVPRYRIDEYAQEADCILIGPGLPREEGQQEGDDDTKELTERLLKKHPNKRWVIDGGSLQTIDKEVLLNLEQMPILTPHQKEFEKMKILSVPSSGDDPIESLVELLATVYNSVVLLKGETDIVAAPSKKAIQISGGNAGMTKGGTGDVLAGLVASLYAKNDAFISACAASYINKRAGESLEKSMGIYFNATDLANEIPKVMASLWK